MSLSVVQDGRVLRLSFSNPERKNAIDYDTMLALGDALLAAAQDRSVRVIVLTGEGEDFCAGADLSGVVAAAQRGITPEMTMDAANRAVKAIVDAPVPVIARIRGAAAGVGVALAVAADLTYATQDAYLLLSFVTIGLMPDGGATVMIAAAAGRALAARMALLGERLPIAEAVEYGLVTGVLSEAELDATVDAAATTLASGPRRAIELAKRALNEATLTSLDTALAMEKAGQAELLQSPDFFEGATAMLAKRRPMFAE